MSPAEKACLLNKVERQSRDKRRLLKELGIPKSTYYRWRRNQHDSKSTRRPWNHITPNEERWILAVALDLRGG